MFITKCNSSAVEYFCLDHHRRLTSTPPPPLARSSSISFEAFSMIVPTMQRIDSNSPELSNQRSVIAKSVSNQVVPVTVLYEHEPEQPQLVKGPSCSPVQYPIIDTVTPGSSASPAHSPSLATTPPLFLLSANSSPVHSSMPANGSSFDYYGYELLKGKRKPIPVPSESKDDAYWERRRRNNLSAKMSREHRRFREVQTNKRIMYLEQENVKLQTEVGFLREELKRLRENELLPYLVRRYK